MFQKSWLNSSWLCTFSPPSGESRSFTLLSLGKKAAFSPSVWKCTSEENRKTGIWGEVSLHHCLKAIKELQSYTNLALFIHVSYINFDSTCSCQMSICPFLKQALWFLLKREMSVLEVVGYLLFFSHLGHDTHVFQSQVPLLYSNSSFKLRAMCPVLQHWTWFHPLYVTHWNHR